jgi:hypothetical protein
MTSCVSCQLMCCTTVIKATHLPIGHWSRDGLPKEASRIYIYVNPAVMDYFVSKCGVCSTEKLREVGGTGSQSILNTAHNGITVVGNSM